MDVPAYPGTSFLVSLHRPDTHHTAARLFLGRAGTIVIFTPLHRLEVRNALRNAVALEQMTPADCRLAFRQVDEDLRDGLLVHTPVAWTDAFRRADARRLFFALTAAHGDWRTPPA